MSQKNFQDGRRDAKHGLPINKPHQHWHGGANNEKERQDKNDYMQGREVGKKERNT